MAVLHLENVPDELVRRLENLARWHQRPVAEEVLHLLEDAIPRAEAEQRARFKVLLEESSRHPIVPRPGTPDSVEMLREDRER
jgi:hypothetical protein